MLVEVKLPQLHAPCPAGNGAEHTFPVGTQRAHVYTTYMHIYTASHTENTDRNTENSQGDKQHQSQNHRMFEVGRDFCGSSSPTPLLKQGHLEQAAQDLVQAGLEYLQRR